MKKSLRKTHLTSNRFNILIPKTLQNYFEVELRAYRTAMENQNLAQAWLHLERAHILGQRYPINHTQVHWLMLCFGFKIKSAREIAGQIPRLLVGGVKSFVGKIPTGNPGGANVPALKPFPIEKDLLEIFEKAGVPVTGC